MKNLFKAGFIGLMLISSYAIAETTSSSNSIAGSSSNSSAIGGAGGVGGTAIGQGGVGGQGGQSLAQAAGGQGGLGGVGGQSSINLSSDLGGDGAKGGGSTVGGDAVAPLGVKVDFGTQISNGADLSKSIPSVFAAGTTAGGSNPCVVSVGFGGSIAGGGLNFSQAYNDSECQVRESLRLMVAILPNSNDKGSQMLIRETACQSDVYWQAMERVFISTKDRRFLCTNPRPDNKPIVIRDRSTETVETVKSVPVITADVVSNYNEHSFLSYE